jgi:hypothetical protein
MLAYTEKAMKKGFGIGTSIGLGLMFFLDPKSGKHRRSVAAHSLVWLGKHIGKGVSWPIARLA